MSGERGNILVIATVIVAVFLATTASVLAFTFARRDATTERARMEAAARGVDAAVGLKLVKIMRFHDKSLFGTLADGSQYAVVCRVHPAGDLFRLTAAVRPTGTSTVVWTEAVVERLIPVSNSRFRSALMAKSNIEISGSARVNGNNHRIDGTPVGLGFGTTIMHDQVAIASKGAITLSGGSKIAGGSDTTFRGSTRPGNDGLFPIVDVNQNAYPSAAYGVTADDHFPTTPDQVLGMTDGDLKRLAQQKGTYFTTDAAWEAWKSALPSGSVPPNQVLYLDFKGTGVGVNVNSGVSDWGPSYHIVVQHFPKTKEVVEPRGGVAGATLTAYVDSDNNGVADGVGDLSPSATGTPVFDGYGWVKTEPDGESKMQVPHVQFNGVFIVDEVTNMNSGAVVFGGVATLAQDSGSVNFMNGTASITYSAASINRAVAETTFAGTNHKIHAVRDRPITYDAQLACEKVGVTITVPTPSTAAEKLAVSALDTSDDPPFQTVDGWRNDWDKDAANNFRSDPAKVDWVAASDTP